MPRATSPPEREHPLRRKQRTARIAVRLKAARKRAGLTQYQLAVGLGVSHRQIIARIEAGTRSLTAEELIWAMKILDVDLAYFIDPFRLEGEGEFTLRIHPGATDAVVDEFEHRAGRWIATFRELSAKRDGRPRWLGLKLALSRHSSFEDAEDAAHAFAERMELGGCPATKLRSVLEDRLGVLVLDVDAPPEIASAAARVEGLLCVLVNRNEPEGHRNFSLAHGLFHLLTWDAIPPDRVEGVEPPRRGKGWLVARLADRFASSVLMPWPVVLRRWPVWQPLAEWEPDDAIGPGKPEDAMSPEETGHAISPGKSDDASGPEESGHAIGPTESEGAMGPRESGDPAGPEELGDPTSPGATGRRYGELGDRLIAGARELRVPALAYARRLHRSGVLWMKEFRALERRLTENDGSPRGTPPPPPFSAPFVRCVAHALDAGRLSAERAAQLLERSPRELASLIKRHGREPDLGE